MPCVRACFVLNKEERRDELFKMDIFPSGNIFRELQVVHDTGYLSAQTSLEDHWEQVTIHIYLFIQGNLARYVPPSVQNRQKLEMPCRVVPSLSALFYESVESFFFRPRPRIVCSRRRRFRPPFSLLLPPPPPPPNSLSFCACSIVACKKLLQQQGTSSSDRAPEER